MRIESNFFLTLKLIMIWSVISLAGCAGQMAYRDGTKLVEQGKPEEGLSKFQEALAADPHDAKYRQAYLETQERSLYHYLDQGDQYLNAAIYDATYFDMARTAYMQGLNIFPGNDKALAGLAAIKSVQHQSGLLTEAEAATDKGDLAFARKRLTEVLSENPKNPRALTLKQTLDTLSEKDTGETQLSKTLKKEMTIEFKDVAVKQVFDVISHTSGLNFIFDKEVKADQKTSIYLKHSTVDSAIQFALMTNQLDKKILDNNTMLIYPNTAAKQKEYQEQAVRVFMLTNAEAKNVAAMIKAMVKSRDIYVDEKLNMLMVRDSPDAIKFAEKLVALQDVAEPEVMLEVEVLEVQRTLLQNLGIQWPASLGLTPQPLSVLQSSSSTSGTSTSSTSSGLTLNDLIHQSKYTLGATVGQTTVNANTQDSSAKLLTNPRIRVKNHEKAKILIGERVPNITSTATATGFVSQSINYIDIGLTLNVEPTVYLDDNVGIKVSLEVSSILSQITTQSGTTAYQIGTRNASTILRLKNGETDVLAGLIDSQERTSGNKIPGIGDAPVLGRLFGSTTDNDENTEIVLSITPHLIRNIPRLDAADAYFLSGTEGSVRMQSGSPDNNEITPSSNVPTTVNVKNPLALPTAPHSPNGLSNVNSGDPSASNTQFGTDMNASMSSAGTATGAASAGAGADVAAAGLANSTSQVQFSWQSQPQVAPGGTVAVALMMQSSQAISNVPLTIGFDNTKLQVVGVSEGPYLKQSSSATNFTSRVTPGGQVIISDSTTGSSGVTNTAVIATVTFRALSATGSTTVQLVSATPTGSNNTPIPVALPTPFSLQITQ